MDWMNQGNQLFALWAEQQQKAMRSLFGQAASPFGAMNPFPGASPELHEGLRNAQAMWQASIEQWVELAKRSLPVPGGSDALLKALFDPAQWTQGGLGPLDRAIEHLVDGPSYATLWTLDRKMLKAQKLRAEWARDLAAYQLLMHAAWGEVVKRFIQEVNDAKGSPITGWRELIDVWIDVANATLTETHRTPEFLEVQRRLTRSGVECRLQEREITEAFCEMHQLPTRTEVDELQRAVYELRRELRNLRGVGAGDGPPRKAAPAWPDRKPRKAKGGARNAAKRGDG